MARLALRLGSDSAGVNDTDIGQDRITHDGVARRQKLARQTLQLALIQTAAQAFQVDVHHIQPD
jgi:hypothetical protein